jgi:hypothetical protein
MANIQDILKFLKSQTAAGRDEQELQDQLDLRQAMVDAREDYSQSPARSDFEMREKQKALAQISESMYAPMRKAESEERARNAEADINFHQEEEVRREARYRKLMNAMNKNR